MKYKVVCNRNDWTRAYDDLETARTAARNHKRRFGHNPVFIYEIEDEVEFTSTQLMELREIDEEKGVIKIHRA